MEGKGGYLSRLSLYSYTPYLAGIIILLALPPLLSSYFLSMLTKVLIFGIFCMSLDLILGYTGMLSLGHAAFMGTAGYVTGIFMVHLGIDNFWALMSIAVLAAGIVAVGIGYLVLRVTGVYFLLLTLAFGQSLSIITVRWKSITGGTNGLIGIDYPQSGLVSFFWSEFGFYYLVLICFVLCYCILKRIVESPFGRSLVGIRENETRMQALGLNTWAHKYIAFIISGLFAGVAGALFAFFYGIMVPEHLALTTSASGMLMVVIGGPGTLFGPVIGALIIIMLEHYASIYSPERWPLILGCVFVICVIFIRGGVGMYLSRLWKKWRP